MATGESEIIYRGALLTLRTQRAADPTGGERLYEIVEHPPAVAIVALRRATDREPTVALVRQSRPAVGGETWELPAGLARDGDETLEEAARRELREEAGVEGGDWSPLGSVLTSPGFTDERVSLFLADGVTTVPGATPDPGEITAVEWLPLTLATARVENAPPADAKTALGLLLAREHIKQDAAGQSRHERRSPMFNPDSATPFAPLAPEMPSTGRDGGFRLENLLLQEFAYASGTAYQALEDRARMFNLYLVLIGALATGVGIITQLGQKLDGYAAEIVVALLTIMGVVGIAFFLKLIRLRQAWRESAIAMNIIKEHYIQMFKRDTPEIEGMFRWRLRTMPTGERSGNISFVVCMTVALLGSLSFAAAVLMALVSWPIPALASVSPTLATLIPWLAALAVIVLSLLAHLRYFFRALDRKREEQGLQNAVKAAGLPDNILPPLPSKH
ncbi:MAG TPA: NUDIX hydrolase [Ktedonobacterales bacterium]